MNEPSERLLQGIEFLNQAGFAAGGGVFFEYTPWGRLFPRPYNGFLFFLRLFFPPRFSFRLWFAG